MTSGSTAEASLRMVPPDTAEAKRLSPEDSFPAVIATSRLARLIELGAALVLEPELRAGQMSVGLEMRIKGTDPFNEPVLLWSRASRNNIHRFSVEILDGGKRVASAEHVRIVVDAHRVAGLARRRAGRPSMQLNV